MKLTIGKYELDGGGMCPEQYDVYLDGKEVAYLRLRHGHFRADVPIGNTIYRATPQGDGCFEDDERARYLAEAIDAVDAYLAQPSARRDDEN